MKEEVVILGGGVAGLSAAIRLAERGLHPLLIEAGSYPSHKICGEFFSPESLPLLEQWGIVPVSIPKVHFRTKSEELQFTFPSPAGSLSHLELDPRLVKVAEKRGARIQTNTRVEALHPGSPHRLLLSNGTQIEANQLVIATGRIPSLNQKPPDPKYVGFKAHFKGLPPSHSLEMFSSPGIYYGMVPIENDHFNVAGLMKTNQSCNLDQLIPQGINVTGWMKTAVPEFEIKTTPDWPRTYFIGDAAATIPPASGKGLTLAIKSGSLVADYLLANDPSGFKKRWQQEIQSPLFFAKFLHRILLNPHIGNLFIKLSHYFPFLPKTIFSLTR